MKTNKKKGISLIVLVITIIIMIILAAAIILSLSGNNVIEKANEAKSLNDVAAIQEQAAMKLAEYELAKANGTETRTAKSYIESEFPDYYANESGMIVATKHEEGTKVVPIPLGFTKSTVSTEDSIDEGLVIKDSEGNEFVWMPVSVSNDNFDSNFTRVGWEGSLDQYEEPFSEGYSTEVSEYNAMRESVRKNGGFYIGRYEAGTETERKYDDTTNNGTNKVVCKKGAFVYNVVGWGCTMNNEKEDVANRDEWNNDEIVGILNDGKGAVELSRSMYAGSESVVSHLIYGVEWDWIMSQISMDVYNVANDSVEYIWDSTNMGWFDTLHRTGEDVIYNGIVGTNKVRNIYDMAGNVSEWTMEAYDDYCRVVRGNSYFDNSEETHCYMRGVQDPGYGTETNIGFRVALYIK